MNKILLVDDSYDLLEFLSQLLRIHNYNVRIASTKKQMETALTSFAPDLILMDVLLNDDNGKVICKEIKRQNSDIAVILFSANPRLLRDYSDFDADGILEKPFDLKVIINTIETAFKKKLKTFDDHVL